MIVRRDSRYCSLNALNLYSINIPNSHSLIHHAKEEQINKPNTPKTSFLADVQALRQQARQHMDEGVVTAGHAADRETVLKLLNDTLAMETMCVLQRYRRYHFMASGIHAKSTVDKFLIRANGEHGHADQIARRIRQLGGKPNFLPDSLVTHNYAEYVEDDSLVARIREDLVAERIAINSYRDTIQYLGDQDPTTRRILEGILVMEEKHANELADLLEDFLAH